MYTSTYTCIDTQAQKEIDTCYTHAVKAIDNNYVAILKSSNVALVDELALAFLAGFIRI